MAQIQGGPAIPVSVVTGGKIKGGKAIPVYGYTSTPTDGRRAAAGPARPVYVVSDAQMAAGTFQLEGGPALPMYVAPSGLSVVGDAAQPVYVVGGSLGGAASTPILDTVTGASIAYSFRKLRTAYSGSAVRLRRDSDNTESDIGFSGSGFDAATAASFVGGGNGYGATFYDQANSYNLTQSTASKQAIYAATNGANSKPCFTFDGSDDIFSRTASIPTISTGVTIFYLSKFSSDSWGFCIGGYQNGAGIRIRALSGNYRWNLQLSGSAPSEQIKAGTTTTYQLVTMRYKAATGVRECFVNGGTATSDTQATQNILQNQTLLYLGGAQHDSLVFSYLTGSVCELILFNSALSDANMQAVNADIGNFYGLTIT